jgi:hypothetical protein
MNLSLESKMLIFEIGVAIGQKCEGSYRRKYVSESDLSRVYSAESFRCREPPLPNGNIMVYNLICHGMSGDEIGLTEEGWCVFDGLRAEYINGCPDWFRENMRRDPRREVFTG